MYEGWILENWPTPFSDVKSVAMVSLVDQNHRLSITLQSLREPKYNRWQVTFKDYPAYRNILEEYRLELWKLRDEQSSGHQSLGNTMTVPDSPWLAALKERESMWDVTYRCPLTHYMICTEDDVIEVISQDPPEIIELAPASPNDPEPGKSRIIYHDEDPEYLQRYVRREILGKEDDA